MKRSINRSVYTTDPQMTGNKQQTMLLLWSSNTVPWSSSDKLKSLCVEREALLLCTFVLTLMTYFINHVVFYWAVREGDSTIEKTWSPREHSMWKEGNLGDIENEMHLASHFLNVKPSNICTMHFTSFQFIVNITVMLVRNSSLFSKIQKQILDWVCN